MENTPLQLNVPVQVLIIYAALVVLAISEDGGASLVAYVYPHARSVIIFIMGV